VQSYQQHQQQKHHTYPAPPTTTTLPMMPKTRALLMMPKTRALLMMHNNISTDNMAYKGAINMCDTAAASKRQNKKLSKKEGNCAAQLHKHFS